MLKISTSQIGYLGVGMKTLAHTLGHRWISPERPGLNGLIRTRRYSPEYCCYPFRLALADCFSALERGADTIIFFGGKGICRLAMYQAVQKEILQLEGYQFRAHVVSKNIRSSLYGPLRTHSPYGRSWTYTPRVFIGFWKFLYKLKVIETWRQALLAVRPYAIRQNDVSNCFENLVEQLDSRDGAWDIFRLKRRGLRQLHAMAQDRSKVLPKVGLVGESYACIDEFTNRRIVARLNAMGIEVVSPLSEYKFMTVVTRLYYKTQARDIKRARFFFKTSGGGDSLLSAAYVLKFARTMDGILHLYPFTCLPETSVRQVVEPYLASRGVPYFHISLDEQTSAEGFDTRLETFADMIHMRVNSVKNINGVIAPTK